MRLAAADVSGIDWPHWIRHGRTCNVELSQSRELLELAPSWRIADHAPCGHVRQVTFGELEISVVM